MIRVERHVIGPGHRFPRHAHGTWSMAAVSAGAGFFRSGGALHEARPGSLTVLHPGEPHDGWVDREEGLDYTVVTVTEEKAAGLHGTLGTPSFPRHVIEDPGCAAAIRAAHRLLGAVERGTDEAEVESVVALALEGMFRRHAQGTGTARCCSALVHVVRRYLDDHYAARISLYHLATMVDVSPGTLVRRFREELGMPPYEYLVSRRVDVARTLIMSGRPLPEIANLTGFADQSHLHRHFTRIVGVTPGRFRRSR
jgi:AraC-like DNA-binding protein